MVLPIEKLDQARFTISSNSFGYSFHSYSGVTGERFQVRYRTILGSLSHITSGSVCDTTTLLGDSYFSIRWIFSCLSMITLYSLYCEITSCWEDWSIWKIQSVILFHCTYWSDVSWLYRSRMTRRTEQNPNHVQLTSWPPYSDPSELNNEGDGKEVKKEKVKANRAQEKKKTRDSEVRELTNRKSSTILRRRRLKLRRIKLIVVNRKEMFSGDTQYWNIFYV